MKTWKDVKVGDTIYYWDHGKLHNQIVNNVLEKIETRTYTFGYRNTTYEDKYLEIHAGKGKPFRLNEYEINTSNTNINSLNRFACIEAAKEWMGRRKDETEKRYLEYKNKYEKCKKIYDTYEYFFK